MAEVEAILRCISMKDVPVNVPMVLAYIDCERENPFDAFVSNQLCFSWLTCANAVSVLEFTPPMPSA